MGAGSIERDNRRGRAADTQSGSFLSLLCRHGQAEGVLQNRTEALSRPLSKLNSPFRFKPLWIK
jgi:hypothetical protein